MFKSLFKSIGLILIIYASPIYSHPEEKKFNIPNYYLECIDEKGMKKVWDNQTILSCSKYANEQNQSMMRSKLGFYVIEMRVEPSERFIIPEKKRDMRKSQRMFEKWVKFECATQDKWIDHEWSGEFCSQYLKRFRSYQLIKYGIRYPGIGIVSEKIKVN